MQNWYAIILSFITVSLVIASVRTGAQDAQTNQGQSHTEFKSKLTVDGIYANVAVNEDGHIPLISVRVESTNEYGFYGQKLPEDPNDFLPVASRVWANQLLYFQSTNFFCGPIEMRDPTGRQLPPIQADIVSTSAYPANFSFKSVKDHNPHPTMFFPIPLIHSPDQLARFSLTNYFDIKEPGEYKLTVWPKIYKRASTNDDLCQRIDVPPVTVPINITAEQLK